jgi:hypothetical protein
VEFIAAADQNDQYLSTILGWERSAGIARCSAEILKLVKISDVGVRPRMGVCVSFY